MKRRHFLGAMAAGLALAGGAAVSQAAPAARGRGHGVGGQVTGVSGTTITVSTPNGGTAVIATTGSTTFEVNGAAGALSGVAVGMYVRAEGTTAADGTFTATKVVASTTRPSKPTHAGRGVGGQVTGVSGTTITVSTPNGGTATIATTGSTTFEVNGAAGALSGVAVGMYVRAEGTTAADGTFTASKVVASTTQPTQGGGRGRRP